MRGNGEVHRAAGGGKKDKLKFLYGLVREFFELMREHGKFITAVDLEDYLVHTMRRYLADSSKPEVAEAVRDNPKLEQRVSHVRAELRKLTDRETSRRVHEHRQQMLMRFCGARLRTPQRLTVLTLAQEQMRWKTTLQAYDRLLWEAMRVEHLEERVVDPAAFVEGVSDTVVIPSDQVPVWLSAGGLRQLFGNLEVRTHGAVHMHHKGP